MSSFQVQLSQCSLNYEDAGKGECVLLVHGFPLDNAMWSEQLIGLSEHCRVISPDLPGFGSSGELESGFEMETCADILAELMDTLEIKFVSFCGLSMGGYIGWQFWKRHSSKLKRLIACNTRAANDSEQVARARKIAAEMVLKSGPESIADGMLEKLLPPTASENVRGKVREMICLADAQSVANGQLAMSRRVDATPWLSEIDVPTLFIAGEHDGITPPEEMQRDSSHVKGSRFEVISDSGHLTPMEMPEQFNAIMKRFLIETESSGF